MQGNPSDQRGLWEADRLSLHYSGQDAISGLLSAPRDQPSSDHDCAEIYCPAKGSKGRRVKISEHS